MTVRVLAALELSDRVGWLFAGSRNAAGRRDQPAGERQHRGAHANASWDNPLSLTVTDLRNSAAGLCACQVCN